MLRWFMSAVLFFGHIESVAADESAEPLPAPFVYLRAIDPTIRQDMRYARADNFTGTVVDGYAAPECVLTRATAEALSSVQKRLAAEYPGHRLKVYDCYRPARAVSRFVEWTEGGGSSSGPNFYHPQIPRSRLIALGYIAAQSGHSRGNVVDLTIERVPDGEAQSAAAADAVSTSGAPSSEAGKSCTAGPEATDSSLDMGTAFDCFDTKSNTESNAVTDKQARARRMLVSVMQKSGFSNFDKEWWHFSYPPGDAGRAMDFVIQPMPETLPEVVKPGHVPPTP